MRTLLAVVCLMLRRAPDVVRTRKFGIQLRGWATTQVSAGAGASVEETRVPPPSEPASPARLPDAPPPGIEEAAAHNVDSVDYRFRVNARSSEAAPEAPVPVEVTAETQENGTTLASEPGLPAERDAKTDLREAAALPPAFDVERWREQAATAATDMLPALAEPHHATREIETELGGVFFLINLGIALGFYGDFTTPAERGIELSIWHFIAMMARGLTDDDDEELARDPVWTMLEELAGNELPECPPHSIGDAIEALHAQAPEVIPVLVRQPARLSLTDAHVDVFYSLQRHPIEIRLAGLDRDPGWVPAAGRYVTFHFN